MQEITEFRIGASHTINKGNFESLRIEATIVVSVPEGSNYAELKLRAQPELRALLQETYRAQNPTKKEKAA